MYNQRRYSWQPHNPVTLCDTGVHILFVLSMWGSLRLAPVRVCMYIRTNVHTLIHDQTGQHSFHPMGLDHQPVQIHNKQLSINIPLVMILGNHCPLVWWNSSKVMDRTCNKYTHTCTNACTRTHLQSLLFNFLLSLWLLKLQLCIQNKQTRSIFT